MKILRNLAQTLKRSSEEQAKWEYRMSTNILSSKKKIAILIALTIPILAVMVISASANAPALLSDKIPFLGGKKALMPSTINSTMFFGSILVGLIAGLITGVIGAGGGYVLTPALMSFGVRGIMAVGTDQFHLFAKAIMGTTIHKKLGNVNFKLAAWFVVGSFVGVSAGGYVNRTLFQHNPSLSDVLISTVYVFVLGILGIYSVVDFIGQRRKKDGPDEVDSNIATTKFALKMQKLNLPPIIKFDEDIVPGGRKISAYPVILIGFVVGAISSIMGVGGGFLTFPIFVYGLGVSTFTTVGTDILQIIFTAGYSSIFQYAIYGYVFYTVSIGMLLGSLVGVQIGAIVTKMVKGSQIRVFYALTIFAGFINQSCLLIKKLADLDYISVSKNASEIINLVGNWVFYIIVSFFALWIIFVFFKNVNVLRAGEIAMSGNTVKRLIVNPRKFYTGLAGVISFLVLLVFLMTPAMSSTNLFVWADNVFNQITKHSVNYIDEGFKKSDNLKINNIDIDVSPREFAEKDKLVKLVTMSGLESKIADNGKVHITGDLGTMSKVAIQDAKLVFDNKGQNLESKYNFSSEEALYSWWTIYDGLSKNYIHENNVNGSSFATFMSQKILEPAYNFRGIEPKSINDAIVPVVALLLFYILYTLWYGFSIMYLFEGLGVSSVSHGKKKES